MAVWEAPFPSMAPISRNIGTEYLEKDIFRPVFYLVLKVGRK